MTGSIAAVVFLTLIACLVLTVPIGFSLGIAPKHRPLGMPR